MGGSIRAVINNPYKDKKESRADLPTLPSQFAQINPMAFLLTITIFNGILEIMNKINRIESAGRLVIPKELRKRYGFESGQRIRLIPGAEGVTLVPERTHRRFIKCGPILTIDTGAGTAPLEAFDVSELRKDHSRSHCDF